MQPKRSVIGSVVDSFHAKHASDGYGALGGALGAAARRAFAAVGDLKSKGDWS
jgi:hypothetical protein